nr:MAG TPA: hypothetical protein [Caudoviricetes sp.]
MTGILFEGVGKLTYLLAIALAKAQLGTTEEER